MRIGYARVSTNGQDLTTQIEALKTAGCERIFRETISGAAANRPEFARMLDQARAGDTIVVCKLDRLARTTRELLDTVERIQTEGANFLSLAEPWADTTNHAGKLIMTVFAGIAEFERKRILERTSEGRTAAQRRGVQFGRPEALSKEQQQQALQMMQTETSIRKIARVMEVSPETIRRLRTKAETAL